MAENLEQTPDLPSEELKKQIEGTGQVKEQADTSKPAEETPAPTTAEEGKTGEQKVEEPPLILGKFKTQEDLIKSYQEIEKRATKSDQLKAQYREAMDPYVEFDADGNMIGVKQQPPTQQQTPQGQSQKGVFDTLEERYNRYSEQHGPIRAQLMVQAEIASAIAQQHAKPIDNLKADLGIEAQKKDLRASDPDFIKYEAEVDKHLARMDAKSKSSKKAVETLYNMVLGNEARKNKVAQEEEAQLKTAEIEKQKQKAQVEHQTKTPEEPKPDIDSLSSKQLANEFGLKKIDRY